MDKEGKQSAWERCVEFHGHVCPGLAIGFKAAETGLEALKDLSTVGEAQPQIVSIVQNDACGVDAVQVLTGCTFGKGNLLFQDHGKQVFSFIRRQDGRGYRVALKYGVLENEEHQALRAKIAAKTATPEEIKKFNELHQEIALRIVNTPAEELFTWREIQLDLPGGAQLNPTVQCAVCGEGVMEQRARVRDGQIVCPECADHYESRLLVLNK